jgi:SAM-dependent methyltransferase/uncharacterized protein YbaR (Trm112 family)
MASTLEQVFVCTTCKGTLAREAAALVCRDCRARYPVIAEIPILIPEDQRQPTLEESMRKAAFLATLPGSFADMIDAYYDHCFPPGYSTELQAYYRRCNKARRVGAISEELGMVSLAVDMFGSELPHLGRVVELGSGWGFSLAAMARARSTCPALARATLCGFDIDPPILVVAQRLFRDLGLDNVFLAVADARLPLPFPSRSVDLLYSNGVVEHVPEQDVLMHNLADVLSADSILHFMIPNRYMIHPEPHYNLRGIGFLPRRLMTRYVNWRLGMNETEALAVLAYSPRHLARLMRQHFPTDLLGAIPVRPVIERGALRTLADDLLGLLAVNGYHCIVRRTPVKTPEILQRRGQLMLSEVPRGRVIQCTRVFRTFGQTTAFLRRKLRRGLARLAAMLLPKRERARSANSGPEPGQACLTRVKVEPMGTSLPGRLAADDVRNERGQSIEK